MSRRSRAAQKLANQKEKEELARKKAAEASQTKHMSKYAAKKLAQMNAPAVDYDDDLENDSSTDSIDSADGSSASSASATTAATSATTAASAAAISSSAGSDSTSTRSNGGLSSEQISAKVTRAVNEAIPSTSGPQRRKIRSFKVHGGTVLRSSIETPAEQTARETKEAKIKASEANLPEKVKAGRAKHRQHMEDIHNARLKALDEIEARGETYKRPSKNKIPDQITFNRESVITCGIETKDRMPDLKDPLERAAALAPHNRRDALLFAPIKRHNSPIKGVDFMVKFLDQWEERMDKNGIFAAFFDQVKHTRSTENGIAYIGLPAFLKFLEGTSKRLIIDQYAFEFNLYIKRREITDFIATMKAPALEWMAQRHPMDPYYAFVYMDTYPVRLKLGKKHIYAEQELFLIGVTLDGRKDLLGIIPDFTSGRLSVDFWERILQHFRNLGTRQICFVVAGFKCRYLERALKTLFPNTTLQFNLLEVLQFDSFKLPDPQRKAFMEDAASLCAAPNFEVAKAQLDLMRDKWEPLMPEGASVLQGNIDLLKAYTLLSLEERKIFTTHKMIAGAATLLLGKKDQLDFFSDHAEMLNYFFYRYLLVAKNKWLECQDYAVYNLTFSRIFAKLRHSDIEGGRLLDELLNQQHQDFMYRHFGRCGTGPVFNINPNRRKISISGQIEPYHSLQKVWGDELVQPQDPEQIAQQHQAASAQALALRQRAQEQARFQYEQAQRAAAATLQAAAQGAAATAAAIAQASHIEATAVAALGGINHENQPLAPESSVTAAPTNVTVAQTTVTAQTTITTDFASGTSTTTTTTTLAAATLQAAAQGAAASATATAATTAATVTTATTATTAATTVASASANAAYSSAASGANTVSGGSGEFAATDGEASANMSGLPLGDSALPAFILNDAKTLNLQTASQNVLQPRTIAPALFAPSDNGTTIAMVNSNNAAPDQSTLNGTSSMSVTLNPETDATSPEAWEQLGDKNSYQPAANNPNANYYLDPQLSQVSADQFNSLSQSNETPISDLEKIDRTYGILPDTQATATAAAAAKNANTIAKNANAAAMTTANAATNTTATTTTATAAADAQCTKCPDTALATTAPQDAAAEYSATTADATATPQDAETIAAPAIAELTPFTEPSANTDVAQNKDSHAAVASAGNGDGDKGNTGNAANISANAQAQAQANANASAQAAAVTEASNSGASASVTTPEDKSSYYLAHFREQKLQESSYAVDKSTSSGLVNRYGSYKLNVAGANNADDIQELQAFDKFEAISLKATAPSAYLMNSVSSNIQSANAILGTLKPSIMQALRADRQLLKDRERQQIFDCLGVNFSFNGMDNVIHQVTPIFRSAMQTKLNWYANHKKEEEEAARVKAKAKARARYLKRQEEKSAKAAELAAHQPVALDSFTPLHSINDLNTSTMAWPSEEPVQEITSLRDHNDFITANPFASPHLGFGSNNPLTLGSDSALMSLSTSTSNELNFTHAAFSSDNAIGTTLEVDFAQQQLKMQPIYGGEQKSLQFAAQIQSSIKVAPTLMTSLLTNTNTDEQAMKATTELSLQQQPNQMARSHKKKQRHAHGAAQDASQKATTTAAASASATAAAAATAATAATSEASAAGNKTSGKATAPAAAATAAAAATDTNAASANAAAPEAQGNANKGAKNRPNNKDTAANKQGQGKNKGRGKGASAANATNATNAAAEAKSDNNAKANASANAKANKQQRRGKQPQQAQGQSQGQGQAKAAPQQEPTDKQPKQPRSQAQSQSQAKQQPQQANERGRKGRKGKGNEQTQANAPAIPANEPKSKNKAHAPMVKNSGANAAVVISSGTGIVSGSEDTKLTVTPNMLQLSTQKFAVNHSEPAFTSESLSAVSLNQTHADESASTDSNDLLHIEKTTDFHGPVPAPEVRSMLAETLATPPGVKTATLDPQLQLDTKNTSQNTD